MELLLKFYLVLLYFSWTVMPASKTVFWKKLNEPVNIYAQDWFKIWKLKYNLKDQLNW